MSEFPLTTEQTDVAHRMVLTRTPVLVCALAAMASVAMSQPVTRVPPGTHLQQLDRISGQSIVVRASSEPRVVRLADSEIGVVVPLGVSPSRQEFQQADQSVAALAGGGFAAIWADFAGEVAEVRLQYIDETGAPTFADGGLVLDTIVNGYPEPAVIAHPGGGVVVAYRHDFSTSRNQLILQWIDATGALRWGPTGQSAFGPSVAERAAMTPHLTAHADGDFSVCVSSLSAGNYEPTVCQRVAANGSPRWNVQGVLAGGMPGWRPMPVTVAGDDNDLFVFWMFHPPDGAPIRVEGQRFSPSGAPRWGATARTLRIGHTASPNSQSSGAFRAISDSDGGAIVVFMDSDGAPNPSYDTLALRVRNDDALPWQDGVAVGFGLEGQQTGGVITTGDGGVVVAFNEFPTAGSVIRTTLQRISPEGMLMWNAPGFVLADADGAMNYNVHGERVGDLLQIAWTRYLPPETAAFDTRLTALTLDGEQIGPPTGALMAGGPRWEFVHGYARDQQGDVGFAVMDSADYSGADMSNTLGALHRRSTDDLFGDGFEGK